MPEWIEFHDSILKAADSTSGDIEILLNAYVHRWNEVNCEWRGTGWMQPVRILIRGALSVAAPPITPVDLRTGRLTVGTVTHDNLCPLPLASSLPVSLWLQLMTDEIIELVGAAIEIETVGVARYIEDLSADLRPQT